MTEEKILELLNENFELLKRKFEAEEISERGLKYREERGFEDLIKDNYPETEAKDILLATTELKKPNFFLLILSMIGSIIGAIILGSLALNADIDSMLSGLFLLGVIFCVVIFVGSIQQITSYAHWEACKKKYADEIAKRTAEFNMEIDAYKKKLEESPKIIREVDEELTKKGFKEFLPTNFWNFFAFLHLRDLLLQGMSWDECLKQFVEDEKRRDQEIENRFAIERQCDNCAYRWNCKKDKILNCASFVPRT